MDKYKAALQIVARTTPDLDLMDAMRLADAFAEFITCTHPNVTWDQSTMSVHCAVCGEKLDLLERARAIPSVGEALEEGKPITAIKNFRAETKWGLVECEAVIDDILKGNLKHG